MLVAQPHLLLLDIKNTSEKVNKEEFKSNPRLENALYIYLRRLRKKKEEKQLATF